MNGYYPYGTQEETEAQRGAVLGLGAKPVISTLQPGKSLALSPGTAPGLLVPGQQHHWVVFLILTSGLFTIAISPLYPKAEMGGGKERETW